MTLKVIDSFFNSRFSHFQVIQIQDVYSLFPWNHDFNSEDIEIMFEDLQREINLQNYVPKKYFKGPIMFLNFIMKQIPNLRDQYLKPCNTQQFFRTYYLEYR